MFNYFSSQIIIFTVQLIIIILKLQYYQISSKSVYTLKLTLNTHVFIKTFNTKIPIVM